jgi:hypothetical protein
MPGAFCAKGTLNLKVGEVLLKVLRNPDAEIEITLSFQDIR